MTTPVANTAHQRQVRKQDLLLASELARGQSLAALAALTQRADAVVERVATVRQWLSRPAVLVAGTAATLLVLGVFRRRTAREPGLRAVRWLWVLWRLWRSAGPLLARGRERD